jgi:diaminohydroxyphosphoribosylaminopyrimidine deaminase / 5-amino-6-(5-phosphoribosylamino)uracil reductase
MQVSTATAADHGWMQRAIDLSRLCPPSDKAYSVGAVVVGADGREISCGYSRETGPRVHAEESALAKIDEHDPRLFGATTYSTLEPCSHRLSARKTCAQLIIDSAQHRVVIAWREPDIFVDDCIGVELLVAAGKSVIELSDLARSARAVNSHLLRH